MSTEQTWQTESTGLDSTLELAMKIGRKLKGGETIQLIGDLGAGKTAFVRGLAAGIGSKDAVRSPSFTIGNLYRGSELALHHFDFYRLDEPGIMQRELAEILEDPKSVAVLEWADTVKTILPEERLAIRITAVSENSRQFKFSYPASLEYLMPEGAQGIR